jgi:hypothetical protein
MEYSYSEAIILRKYYLEKLIGKKVNDSFENTISEIAIKELPNGKYVVTPGFWYENRDFIFLEINKVAKKFGLLDPIEVLSTHKH